MSADTNPTDSSLTGQEAVSKLIDIWLNGFSTGHMSAALNGLRRDTQHLAQIPDEVVSAAADLTKHVVDNMTADPLAIDTVRQQIQAVLMGVHPGLDGEWGHMSLVCNHDHSADPGHGHTH